MTTTATHVDQGLQRGYPQRYRAAEKRGARLGIPLRLAAHIRTVDEDLMQRLGRGFWDIDPLGEQLKVIEAVYIP